MKKIIIFVVLGGLLFLLNYTNPEFEDHKEAISTEIELDSPVWEKLEYRDFFVASFTSNAKRGSMATFGIFKFVKVIDEELIKQENK